MHGSRVEPRGMKLTNQRLFDDSVGDSAYPQSAFDPSANEISENHVRPLSLRSARIHLIKPGILGLLRDEGS